MKKPIQENFPVACLFFEAEKRKIIADYYNFARYCDDIADNPSLSESEKLSLLEQMENALLGKGHSIYATQLREDFISHQLDFSLATDLLKAFKQDAHSFKYQTWRQLLDYCHYSAVPVGRFMLALYNENPSTYLPAAALCSALQIINHIQDLKNDVQTLHRLYFPQDLLDKHKVTTKALSASNTSKSLHFLLNDVLNRCKGLMKDAKILPAIVTNHRLKLYLCITLNLSNILINKLYNADILKDYVKLSWFDWVKACLLGLWKMFTLKHQTLTSKGL